MPWATGPGSTLNTGMADSLVCLVLSLGREKQPFTGQVLTLLGTAGSHLLPGGHAEGCPGVRCRTRAGAKAEHRAGGTAEADAGRRPQGPARLGGKLPARHACCMNTYAQAAQTLQLHRGSLARIRKHCILLKFLLHICNEICNKSYQEQKRVFLPGYTCLYVPESACGSRRSDLGVMGAISELCSCGGGCLRRIGSLLGELHT